MRNLFVCAFLDVHFAKAREWMIIRSMARSAFGANFMVVILLLLVMLGCSDSRQPQLVVDGTVAPDLEDLAKQTWAQFVEAFAGRSYCFDDVTLMTSANLESRAVYKPESATTVVEVPATAALLQAALVHEWAHHIEFQCNDHATLRGPFLAAQKLPPDADWFHAPAWAEIPSEQFAEATVLYVLGLRRLPTGADVESAAVEVLSVWASGETPNY
jgi:hypothetical protein